MTSTTYVIHPRYKVTGERPQVRGERPQVWAVWRWTECVATFRVHADAIAWADRKARGQA